MTLEAAVKHAKEFVEVDFPKKEVQPFQGMDLVKKGRYLDYMGNRRWGR